MATKTSFYKIGFSLDFFLDFWIKISLAIRNETNTLRKKYNLSESNFG